MNVLKDREFAINELNRLQAEEGFDVLAIGTGKAIISEKGILWHEVLDPEFNILSYVTTSVPEIQHHGYMDRVWTASDDDEIAQYDHQMTFKN